MKKAGFVAVKVFLPVIIAFVLFAQGCMTMRTPDSEAVSNFLKSGIDIHAGYMTVAGRKLHYVKCGADTNATLFFIHGSPGSWDAFGGYLKDKDLLARYRMISIDRPGFGYSAYGRGVDLEEQSKVIGEVIVRMQNGQPFYIIGHSLGGPLCVKLAAGYKQYISGVVLLAASVDPNEEKAERWRPLMKTPPFRWLMPGAFRPSNDELWYFKKDIKTMPADLSNITCPVTIMQGMNDSMVPPGNAYYAQKQLVHSSKVKLIMIPDANHFIPWTRFELIKDVLLNLNTR